MRDKKLPTEWIFFERVLSATSYTITSNPQSHFSRVLSFNEKGLKISIKDNMDFEDINSFTQHSLQESFRPLAEVLYSRPYLIFAYHGDFIKYRSSFRDGLLLIGVWWIHLHQFFRINSSFIPCFISAFSDSEDSLLSILTRTYNQLQNIWE